MPTEPKLHYWDKKDDEEPKMAGNYKIVITAPNGETVEFEQIDVFGAQTQIENVIDLLQQALEAFKVIQKL